MDKLLFWLGLGAAQKGAGSKPTVDRHWVVSLVVGILIAVLIAAAAFILLVSQQSGPDLGERRSTRLDTLILVVGDRQADHDRRQAQKVE